MGYAVRALAVAVPILYQWQTEVRTITIVWKPHPITTGLSGVVHAWQVGPVVREVYNKYCGFGSLKICMNYDETIRDDYANIIDRIVEEKRLLDPGDMGDDTHTPGKAGDLIYRDGVGNHQVIPKELIRKKD